MKKIYGDVLSRPRFYSFITGVLSPFWAYTPVGVAKLAAHEGLIDALVPNPYIHRHLKIERARVNFGRYRKLKGFPEGGDMLMQQTGRWFSAWYGWRWHGYLDSFDAERELMTRLALLFGYLDPSGSYDIEMQLELWKKMPLPPCPKFFGSYDRPMSSWRRSFMVSSRIILVRYAMERGLSLTHAYDYHDWVKPVFEEEVPLEGIIWAITGLEGNLSISISEIMARAIQQNLLSGEETTLTQRYRISLYRLCRSRGFPEHGDRVSKPIPKIPEPAWKVSRWRSALVDSLARRL